MTLSMTRLSRENGGIFFMRSMGALMVHYLDGI
jgi:hypothetical protein